MTDRTRTYHQHRDRRQQKLAALFAEASKRGIEHDELRNVIAPAQIGKRLSKASPVEIQRLLEYIGGGRRAHSTRTTPHPPSPHEGRGDEERGADEKLLMSGFKERYDDLGLRDGMATPRQLRMIEGMWMDVSRMPTYEAREKALTGFLRRIVGVDDLRFVEAWMVQKVARAITAMRKNSR